jgi:hypothetical protein
MAMKIRPAFRANAAIFLLATNITVLSQTIFYQDDATKQIDFSKTINGLKKAWEAGNVHRVEVIHIPTNWTYRTSVSTSTIDASYLFKLTVQSPKESKLTNELMETIKKLEAKPLGKPADLRWGCVFYSTDNTRLFSIYFDASGLEGVVDGACVKLSSPLLKQWAEQGLHSAFR